MEKKLAKSLGLQQNTSNVWMQEFSILPGHLRSPPFLVGFVLWDLLCLSSVLLIMV